MIYYLGEGRQDYIYHSDDDFVVCGCIYEHDTTSNRYYYYDSSKNWRCDRDVRRRMSKKEFFADLAELKNFFIRKKEFVKDYEQSIIDAIGQQSYKCLGAAIQ